MLHTARQVSSGQQGDLKWVSLLGACQLLRRGACTQMEPLQTSQEYAATEANTRGEQTHLSMVEIFCEPVCEL